MPTLTADFADWFLCQGRTEEALSWARRAQELDPLALHGIDIGWILFHARRYDEAIRELHAVLAIEPEKPGALWFLGFALIGAERFDEAIQILERVASASHRSSAVLGLLVQCLRTRWPPHGSAAGSRRTSLAAEKPVTSRQPRFLTLTWDSVTPRKHSHGWAVLSRNDRKSCNFSKYIPSSIPCAATHVLLRSYAERTSNNPMRAPADGRGSWVERSR